MSNELWHCTMEEQRAEEARVAALEADNRAMQQESDKMEARVAALEAVIEDYLLWEPRKKGHAAAHERLRAAVASPDEIIAPIRAMQQEADELEARVAALEAAISHPGIRRDLLWMAEGRKKEDRKHVDELLAVASPDTNMSAENKESLACTKRYHVVPGGIREPLDTRMYRCACGLVLMSGIGTTEIRFGLVDRLYPDTKEGT